MADRVWSEKDLIRRANRRLAVLEHAEEVSGNVAATCRYYGISRNVFYRWKRRYEDEGLDGLKDRSSAPLLCPTITHPDVVEKIIHLRQSQLAAFIQQRIRHVYRRQRPSPLSSRPAQSRHQSQLGVDGLDVTHSWRLASRAGLGGQPKQCILFKAA